MGLGDFWLQFNNGKKEQLNDTKHGVRKEQVDKKFHNLFDAYDANNDGTLEENELQTIFGHLKNFAGDNVLDSAENLKAKSIFADQVGMQDVDFQGFVKSVSDATANIISSEEKATSDGGKEIKTEYKDGTTETIAYYSNGDFKWKKIEKRFAKTTYEMILDGKRQELTEEQYNQALKKLNEKPQPQQKPKANFGIEGQKRIVFPQPTPSVEVKTTTNKWEEHTQEYSPRFIAEKLGVDINTDEGKKILERMSYLPKEALDQIKDGAELNDVLSSNELTSNFDNISNVLELMYGVTLRNEEEYEGSKPQREKIVQQIQTVGIMSELYARVAEFNDTYTDNQGVFGLGSEGIGWILNKIGIQGENHYQWADSCREFIEKINNFKVLNPTKFEEEFKELTGKEKFNVEALQKMVELAKDGKAQDEYGDYTDEYKQAVKEFSNFDVTNINARAWYHPLNLLNGFGEVLAMIATLGWGAETKAGQMLATSTMATFGKAGVTIASKQVNNRLLQGALRLSGKGVKLLAPMINEGTKMYAYTAVMGTATNVANRAIKFDSEDNTLDKFIQTEAMVLDSATGSFGFGAFAGAFGSTVTQKVMQRASKVSQKVGTALSDKFAKGAVDANEVFTTILEKSAPTKIAEVAAFATDVLGFTAFESVLAIVKNLDNFPDGYSVEDLTNIIWEELKSQGYNLGQIKIVAWLMSSRSARMQATRYMKNAMPQLRGATVEGVNGGKDGYKINLPDGRKVECKNTTEYISALHLMVRGEKIKGGKKASDAVEGAIGKEITDGAEGTPRTKTNDINSNTKSEKVISDRTSGKKTYQKPETEVKSFVAEDDLLADTTKPKTKAKPKAVDEPRMVLRENKPVTVEQARNMLLDLGFPIEEVNAFTFDNNSLININYIYFTLKEKLAPDFADIDFSSSADNVIEARKDIFGFLKAETGFEYKFVNKENIAEYNKYISINNFDELSDVINILENDLFKEHIDDLMKIIPIITKNGKEKLTVKEYKELKWINEDAFKFITPERAEFVSKINSNVPEEYKIGLNSYDDLGASETLTEEFAKQYVNEVNRFIKHGVNDGTSLYQNGLKNKMREMKEISDFLDKYPLELGVDDKGLIHSLNVKQLMTRPDIEKVQKLLHEMTPEARQNISVDRLPEPDSDIPFDKWRDFFNFISNGSFSQEQNSSSNIHGYKFVDFVRKQNIKDLDSFMEYMELLRGTYAYSWEYQFNEYFVISNNDYKNAASMLREMKNICDSISPNTFDDHFVSYQLRYIIGNQDIDFKEVTKRLKYLQEKNVKFKEDSELYRIAVSKHPDTAKLAEILYETGFGANHYSLDDIFKNMEMTPEKLQGMMDDFVSELMKSCDLDDNFDINLIKEAALSKDADAIFCGIMRGDKCPDYAVSRTESVLRKNNKAFYDKYWNKQNSPFKSNELFELGSNINDKNIELALKICDDEEFIKDFRFVRDILISTVKYDNKRLSESLLFDKSLNFEKSQIIDILRATNADNLYLATKLCTEPQLKFPKEHIAGILSQTSWINSNLAEKLCFDKDFPKDLVQDILRELNNYSKRDILDFADWICFDKDVNFPKEKIADLLGAVNNVNKDFAKRLLTDKSINIPQEIIANILRVTNAQNLEEATRLCLNYKRLEIEPNQIPMLLSNANPLSIHQVRKVNKVLGRKAVAQMSESDFKIAAQFIDIMDVTNINEIPAHAKKDFLKALVACNEGLFNISDDLKKMFPMIPTNRDDYCSLLPAIVRSLGIETNILKPEQVIKFNKSMGHLSESLAKISDTDFANLHITQEYSRNEFIQTTLQKLKGLSDNERQKVFDYFGFELHTYSVKTDKLDPNGKPIYEKHYTITGYPVNLNNGHKLAQITNPETKSFVENLRPDVIRFSKNNRIKCENPQVETLLNELAEALPELHSIVGRVQHGSHQYDVLQHSLKVMQKISQDSNFKKLSDSDKKIMLLASIMHDITKKEGTTDVMHAINGSFDTFFIAKKFNLTKEEEIKLYTLIKHHEWLSYANSSSVQSEEVLTKRLQSIAYDLRHDNMFDLALMFTHADLRAVKVNDAFHDSKIGKSRINFNGEVHSFGESADIFAKRIREYIAELKKSQPILPVTKMPRASRMKQAITHVNPDGSTNIKGVYQDKDGLLIVRFNEVEDWEALGLPKGSISKGIKAGDDVDTGNIHFFVHGLDYVNQLVKFDAFGMIDSEVLLSMSYAERPESKFRFFRTQGVLLDVPTKYVHGGGNTDAGSGCGKFVSEFKKNYIFGGHRESDRLYISNLVKEATGMSDDEYVKFVEKYENKPFTDIYPEDIRNKIIKIFAEINSRVRKYGERSYNEMYGSNPSDVMGVFGYPTDLEGKIGDNIFDFVKSNGNLDGFLRQYALERDIPMYILGY